MTSFRVLIFNLHIRHTKHLFPFHENFFLLSGIQYIRYKALQYYSITVLYFTTNAFISYLNFILKRERDKLKNAEQYCRAILRYRSTGLSPLRPESPTQSTGSQHQHKRCSTAPVLYHLIGDRLSIIIKCNYRWHKYVQSFSLELNTLYFSFNLNVVVMESNEIRGTIEWVCALICGPVLQSCVGMTAPEH